MSKKLWKFCITYKIKGLEKRWFNRYKKIEETEKMLKKIILRIKLIGLVI